MFNNTPKIKNVYVPLAVIALALVLMLVEVLFLSNDATAGALEKLTAVAVKTILYMFVLLLGMVLCSWFGYPFDPIHWSLFQMLAVTLITGAVRGTLGIPTGNGIATLLVSCSFWV